MYSATVVKLNVCADSQQNKASVLHCKKGDFAKFPLKSIFLSQG